MGQSLRVGRTCKLRISTKGLTDIKRTDEVRLRAVAHIHSDFAEKFGIPRQSGLVDELEAVVVFEPEYRVPEALRGIGGFSHLWLIWQFTESMRGGWSPTVRPPKLGGNTRIGVFATRSPFRPNPLALSCVRLKSVESTARHGTVLRVCGADLMDGTPIFDIKPYLPFTDCRTDAVGGFSQSPADGRLRVEFPEQLLNRLAVEKRSAAVCVLSYDPRPGYHAEEQRVYGLTFAGAEIHFRVEGDVLIVVDVETG